jgi:uncharacterized protein
MDPLKSKHYVVVRSSVTVVALLLATLVMVAGAMIQGSIGFGVALLGAPLLFLINPMLVPAPVIIAGMTLPVMILARDHHAVVFRDLAWALPRKLAGTVAAAVLIGIISADALGLLFGVLVLVAVLLCALGWAPRPGPGMLLSAGGLSGFMATSTSIGGPPLALVYRHQTGARLRGTLSAIFIPGGVLSLTALALVGRFGLAELLAGLALLPGVILGFWLSNHSARYLDRSWLPQAVLAISALAAIAAILRSIG